MPKQRCIMHVDRRLFELVWTSKYKRAMMLVSLHRMPWMSGTSAWSQRYFLNNSIVLSNESMTHLFVPNSSLKRDFSESVDITRIGISSLHRMDVLSRLWQPSVETYQLPVNQSAFKFMICPAEHLGRFEAWTQAVESGGYRRESMADSVARCDTDGLELSAAPKMSTFIVGPSTSVLTLLLLWLLFLLLLPLWSSNGNILLCWPCKASS